LKFLQRSCTDTPCTRSCDHGGKVLRMILHQTCVLLMKLSTCLKQLVFYYVIGKSKSNITNK